jgi:hypothetical protein
VHAVESGASSRMNVELSQSTIRARRRRWWFPSTGRNRMHEVIGHRLVAIPEL